MIKLLAYSVHKAELDKRGTVIRLWSGEGIVYVGPGKLNLYDTVYRQMTVPNDFDGMHVASVVIEPKETIAESSVVVFTFCVRFEENSS